MKATVEDRQTLMDIALERTGQLEGVWELAVKNGLSMTDEVRDGQELILPDVECARRVVELYGRQRIRPATEVSAEEMGMCPYGGIGFMAVGVDFEIK